MTADRMVLEQLDRNALIAQASALGVARPEVLTRVELIDEILRLKTSDPVERRRARGWLGVARDLLASVVEQGLNLPDAAALIRGDTALESVRPLAPPVATVTLAEIYRAQGHLDRALSTLEEVLGAEPDHPVALRLRDDFLRQRASSGSDRAAPESGKAARAHEVASHSASPPTPAAEKAEAESPRVTSTMKEPEPESVVANSAPNGLELEALPIAPGAYQPAIEDSAARVSASNSGLVAGRSTSSDATGSPGIVATAAAGGGAPRDNALVAFRLAGGGLYLYWELCCLPEHCESASTKTVIQVLECRPHPRGAERLQHRIEPAEQLGGVVLPGVAADAAVRAVVGIDDARSYRPLAVAVECRQGAAGALDLLFVPWKRADLSAVTRRAAAALQQHESAR